MGTLLWRGDVSASTQDQTGPYRKWEPLSKIQFGAGLKRRSQILAGLQSTQHRRLACQSQTQPGLEALTPNHSRLRSLVVQLPAHFRQ